MLPLSTDALCLRTLPGAISVMVEELESKKVDWQ